MKQVWQADDGKLFEDKQWCEEYESLLKRAEKAIEPVKFRVIREGWNLDPEPIKKHPVEVVHKAWSDFLEVVKELVVWSEVYTKYQSFYEDEPRDIQQTLLDQLDKYSKEHRVLFPIALKSMWPKFREIAQKFESLNMENGEEYVGSFGIHGMEGRREFLKVIENKEDHD